MVTLTGKVCCTNVCVCAAGGQPRGGGAAARGLHVRVAARQRLHAHVLRARAPRRALAPRLAPRRALRQEAPPQRTPLGEYHTSSYILIQATLLAFVIVFLSSRPRLHPRGIRKQ